MAFSACPRCTQTLPTRPAQYCDVCGQEDMVDLDDPAEVASLESDIASRRAELNDVIASIDSNLARMRARRSGLLLQAKDKAEADINRPWRSRTRHFFR